MRAVRRVACRRLGERSEIRRLGECHFGRGFPEEVLRSFLDAVDGAAVGGFVEVDIQNLVFCRHPLQFERKDDFFCLPDRCLVGREKRVLDDLLCNRRAALPAVAGAQAQIDENGAQEGHRAEPVVLVESGVLDRDARVPDIGGDLVERDFGAAHRTVDVVEEDVAGAVIYFR